jgi:hypothetical protein
MKKHLSLIAFAILLGGTTAACTAANDEAIGETSANATEGRFNRNHPAPNQVDDWSCSVHTTTWMLQSTRHDVSWGQMASHMQKTGRVSQAVGLTDASGAGLAQTLRDFAEEAPNIGHSPLVSFDDVAARAGRMAVGIGGRGWNHWSAVRGYDDKRDVILLANSAPNWKGVGQELDRGEFARLGGFSMVWLDYGQTPPPPPFEPSPRPTGGDFQALHVKTAIPGGEWITQCNESADGERVWQSTNKGPDPETRWAEAKYPQNVSGECGQPGEYGIYPVIFRSRTPENFGAWVVQCSGWGDGSQHVYRVDTEVEGHPAAVFLYNEPNPECE